MSVSETETLRFSFGRIHWRAVRHFLQTTQLEWPDIRFVESDGWLARDFAVFGPTEKVEAIRRSIETYCDRLDAAERKRAIQEQKQDEQRRQAKEASNRRWARRLPFLLIGGIALLFLIAWLKSPPLT